MQCMPGDPKKVLVTSNDSRVRVYDGLNLVAKYKGTLYLMRFLSDVFFGTGTSSCTILTTLTAVFLLVNCFPLENFHNWTGSNFVYADFTVQF